MKFVKLVLISIIVLFFILTALGLLLPSVVRVTRNITLHASFDTIYSYTDDMGHWPLWMEGIDTADLSFTTAGTKGKGSAASIGALSVRITGDENNTVTSVWKTGSGKEQLCVFQLFPDSAKGTTNLNWYFEQKLHWYPWERLPAIANDKVMGPFMEQSLDKLKALTERN